MVARFHRGHHSTAVHVVDEDALAHGNVGVDSIGLERRRIAQHAIGVGHRDAHRPVAREGAGVAVLIQHFAQHGLVLRQGGVAGQPEHHARRAFGHRQRQSSVGECRLASGRQ